MLKPFQYPANKKNKTKETKRRRYGKKYQTSGNQKYFITLQHG